MEERIERTLRALRKNHFEAEYYEDGKSAVEAVLSEIDTQMSVGIGGSVTVHSLKLHERLLERGNPVHFHWLEETREKMNEARKRAMNTDIYLSSTNALTGNGELVNIDGQGNRVASMIYGHEKVYILCGKNKIVDNLPAALEFIKKNAYKNARRLKLSTPCALTGQCHDCDSPQRMCRVTTVIGKQPMGAGIKVVIIGEELGF